MSDVDFRYPLSTIRKDNSQLISLSSQGHPAYNPVKLNIKTASEMNMKLTKTKAPEKPLAPYMRFSRKVWDQVKAAHPEAKLWEIGKTIGQMWRDLSDNEKQEYIYDYENAKADYCEQLKNYHNSPQYQSFLLSMTRKKLGKGYEDNLKCSQATGANVLTNSNILNSINSSNKSVNSIDMWSNYAIEPAEDDGIDDGFTIRHVCSARFNRNHKLINEIFSEYVVPDYRSIITGQRMEQLKKQVTSLELHQEKLKQELQTIEEKNEMKKKKFLTTSENFQNEIKKFKEYNCTDDETKALFNKNYEEIQKEWKEKTEKIVNDKNMNSENINIQHILDEIVYNKKNIPSIQSPNQINLILVQKSLETFTSNPNNVQNSASTNVTQSNIVIQNQQHSSHHNNSYHQNQTTHGSGSHNLSHPNQNTQSNINHYSTNQSHSQATQQQQNLQTQMHHPHQNYQQQLQPSSNLTLPISQQVQNPQVIMAQTQQLPNQAITQQQVQPIVNSSSHSAHMNSQQVIPVQPHSNADYSNYQHQQNNQNLIQPQYQPQYGQQFTSQNVDMQHQQHNQIYQQNQIFQPNQFNPQFRAINFMQSQSQQANQMHRVPVSSQMNVNGMNVRPIIGSQSQIPPNIQSQPSQTISQPNQSVQFSSSNSFNMQQQPNTQLGNQFRTSNTPPINNSTLISPSQQPNSVQQNPNQGAIVPQQQMMHQHININQTPMINRMHQPNPQQPNAQLQMRQPIQPQQVQTSQQSAQGSMMPQQSMIGYYPNQTQQNYYSSHYSNQIIPGQQNQMSHFTQNNMNTQANSSQYPQPVMMPQGQIIYPPQTNIYGMQSNQSQMMQPQSIMNSQYIYQQPQQQQPQQIHSTPPPTNQGTINNNLSPSNTQTEKTKSKKKGKATKNTDSISDK